jgi:hypothetical protein
MEPHEILTQRQLDHEPAFYVGQWTDQGRVVNRTIEEDGSVFYLFGGGDWVPESSLTAVSHTIPLGAAVKIATPTIVNAPGGEREERDDTVYRVLAHHFTDDGQPSYALAHFIRGQWVQCEVVAEKHLEAVPDDSVAPLGSIAVEKVTASSSGVMT